MKSILSAAKSVLVCGIAALALPVLAAPVQVELLRAADGWQLKRDGQPFFIKGAGGSASLAQFKAAGGNSIRTWSVDNLQATLDDAQAQGLTVCAGIWLHHENDTEKFSYRNPEMVAEQLEQVRQAVTRFKDHPALLLWGIGNEMEGQAGDQVEIWNAVEAAAKLTKQLDPNHPTMTVIAEIGGQKMPFIHKYCPDIDIIGINSYGGGSSVAERYAKLNGTKPYIITEFGPVGQWEIAKTSWGAPYEQTSTEKAAFYRKTYEGSIAGKPLCLGSYAFLWGQKQEATATWFGMFLKSGEKLGAVDTMSQLWTGNSPANPCPGIHHLKLRGSAEVSAGKTFTAELDAFDPAGQPLQVRWVIQPEQLNRLSAGAEESQLPEFMANIIEGDLTHAVICAPEEPGAYRLFAYVRNASGAAVANVPFYVSSRKSQAAAADVKLPFVVYEEKGSPANHYVPSGWMGNTKAVRMDDGSRVSPHSGDTCLRFEYQDTADWGGVVWQDVPGNWGEQPGGWNLTGAKRLVFWARGEKGGEEISVKYGLLGKDKPYSDSANGSLENLKLTPEWKKYVLDLTDQDLSTIKTGFCWVATGAGAPLMFYLDDIRFE